MKFLEAYSLYKKFIKEYYKVNQDCPINECLLRSTMLSKESSPIKRFEKKLPGIYLGVTEGVKLWDFVATDWDIYRYRNVSMSSNTNRPHHYTFKTSSVIRYLNTIEPITAH